MMGILILVTLFSSACPSVGTALTSNQLLIVTNGAVPEGIALAQYYMKGRNVPAGNVVQVQTTKEEHMSREEYEDEIASPVREFLTTNDSEGARFRCIVLMYGIPLRIDPPQLTAGETTLVHYLKKRLADLRGQIEAADQEDSRKLKTLRDEESRIAKQIQHVGRSPSGASVDSEIALVLEGRYPLDGWLPSRFFVGSQGEKAEDMPQKALMVSRLDGPSEATVYRIIDDSIQTEKEGLAGTAYFDARWTDGNESNPSPYRSYDRAIHNAAHIVEKSKKLPVVLDEQERLLQPGEAPNAALYCGWYSLGKYVDAFTWVRGAVGFHVASGELTTLKGKTSTVWCKVMLEKGVAATVGPVAEPYLQAFPQPEVFFGCLLEGHQLAECYAASNPFWSWQMVLIGDPLYRPFGSHDGGAK